MNRLLRLMITACLLLLTSFFAVAESRLPDPVSFRIGIELGDLDQAKEWLNNGLDPNFQGDRLGSALHIAAWNGNVRMLELFAARGAKLDLANQHGEQPLHLAALQSQTAAVDWLLARGAPLNSHARQSAWTALHYAAFAGRKDLITRFLEKGADINARAPNGTTPLMAAIYEGKREVAEFLLRRGADRSLKNDWGDGALEWAMKYKQTELAKLIASPEEFASAASRPSSDWNTQRSETPPANLQRLLREREDLIAKRLAAQKLDQTIAALRFNTARKAAREEKKKKPTSLLAPLTITPTAAQRARLAR